ncbi:MAG: hypothetical protein QOJ42_3633 [Acidobacteriaceae bacterium]|nr:hypothetical protein [Acidobacteriaceae bacterium]
MALTERMNERRVLTPQSFTCEGSYTLDYSVFDSRPHKVHGLPQVHRLADTEMNSTPLLPCEAVGQRLLPSGRP